MSGGNEENSNKKRKRVVSTDVTNYHTKTEYHVRYDDGTKDSYTESKTHLGGSRYSRYVDFIRNAKVGDIREDSIEDKRSKKDITNRKNGHD